MGHMALVAVCDGTVGTVRPGGKLRRHDVAVRAGSRIVGHVGGSLRVDEGESADARAGIGEDRNSVLFRITDAPLAIWK